MPAAGDEEMLEAKSLEAPFSFKTDAIFHYWQEEKAGDEGRPGRYCIGKTVCFESAFLFLNSIQRLWKITGTSAKVQVVWV